MSNQNDFLDLINIPSPCSADWDSMTGNNRVRFCGQCKLNVHDISEMPTKAVVRLVASSQGRLCVRYYKRPESVTTQPDAAPPLYQIGRRASRIAAGVFSATLSLSAAAIAAQAHPKANPLGYAGAESSSSREAGPKRIVYGASATLVGRVLDENGAVVAGASVTLINADTQSEQTITSGEEGEFRFQSLEAGTYHLKTHSPGFEVRMIVGIAIPSGGEQFVTVTLSVAALGGDVVVLPSDPLVSAAMNNDIKALKELLDAPGVNVNLIDGSYGMTALAMAVVNGHLEAVQLLLWYGADVNLKSISGQTPLMSLSRNSNVEIARALITAGAEVNLQDDDGDTALILVAADGNTEVLQALIDAGASVNLKNKSGRTALMQAANGGSVGNVKALMEAGANMYERDAEGKTVVDYARENDHNDVVEALRPYGAIE